MIFTQTVSRMIVLAGIVVFTGSAVPSAHAQSEVLTVAAASSLKDVFRKILPLFEAQNPDISVRVIYAQPKTLVKQIEEGAPVDVLLPAQFEDIDQLEKNGLILQDTKRIYARTTLVLITNAAFPASVGSIQDLETTPVRRIAIGDPAASAVGKDTIQFLRQEKLEPRLRSQFIYGEHSRAVLDLVSKGEAELGIVYQTDALTAKRVRIVDTAPADNHRPMAYGIAAPWTAQNIAGARELISFLMSAPVQTELKKYGFERASSDVSFTQRREVQP
ncbi:MAG: Molybdenum ABC transporter, substrate-binding protein ModA [Nitrospira sp.]|jgi:molybdate transport system substrate-binding protein|nr:MAG: Molybdenum ABC transporter, substrate-binding protein ModA [Nitrospira sp.]